MLPDNVTAARRLVNRHAVLRIVSGTDVGVLPDDPDVLVAPRTKPAPRLFVGIVLAGLSAGISWLATAVAWEDEGLVSWIWNAAWTVLPWVLLVPLWIGYLASWRRNEVNDIQENFDRFTARATRFEGSIAEIRVAVSSDRTVRRFIAKVTYGPSGDWAGSVVVGRMAAGPKLSRSALPRPGDLAYVWIQRVERGEFVVVQTTRSNRKPALSAELAKLAELHDSGHLNADEFAAAKRRILEP